MVGMRIRTGDVGSSRLLRQHRVARRCLKIAIHHLSGEQARRGKSMQNEHGV